MSSSANLRFQIKEDHLTCSICLNSFRNPKALPCLHTFCKSCLQDYVVSRNYESTGKFPCPLCREETAIPLHGIQAFPDNHLVASLSDTVDQSQHPRPIPKPRRSLGGFDGNSPSTGYESPRNQNPIANRPGIDRKCEETECSSGPDGFEMVDEINHRQNQSGEVPPPPYASVADTHPDENHTRQKVCANDTDQSWMVVAGQAGNPPGNSNLPYPGTSANTHDVTEISSNQNPHRASNLPPAPIGWNLNALGPSDSSAGSHISQQSNPHPCSTSDLSQSHQSSSPLYPNVPMDVPQNTGCSENLMLCFGKQGSTARDFIKPIGLAISKEGNYVISDNGGDQNRFLVFNSGGEITTAFKCGCKVKDIAVTQNNEMIAAIQKPNSAIRRFTLSGQLKGEYGKFFTFEEMSGIAELSNKGVVLTGVSNHCIYVLTPEMKLQTKFGRKGNGDGYFSHPGFVAVDSKNHIIISDKSNNCIQVFDSTGHFKQRFGSTGKSHGLLQMPMGICADSAGNIIVADSGNFRVEAFSSKGRYLCSVVRDTWQLGEDVKPINVSVTPTGKVAVLLRGPYFAEVRVYTSRHKDVPQDPLNSNPFPVSFESALAIPKSLGLWPSNK